MKKEIFSNIKIKYNAFLSKLNFIRESPSNINFQPLTSNPILSFKKMKIKVKLWKKITKNVLPEI